MKFLVSFALGLFISSQTFAARNLDRSICGKDDMEDMIKLGADMQSMGTPIGILDTDGGLCSGTLIDKDLFLTSGHCKSACNLMKVTFGFLSRTETFGCKEIVEADDSGVMNKDYMIIRLEGSPGVVWGWYDMSDKDVPSGTELLIIHHPEGLPMKVSRTNCVSKAISGGMLSHTCDTNPGTSGSAIIVPDYDKPMNSRIVGVHGYGGCNANSTSYNSGPAIKNLVAISPLIKKMLK